MASTDNSIYEAAGKIEAALLSGISTLTYKLPGGSQKTFTSSDINWIGAAFTTPNAKPWIRNNVINLGIIDQDASRGYEINRGLFTVALFFPKGSGREPMNAAKKIKDLFTAEIFDDLVVEQVIVSPTSEPESSPWFGVNIQITFTYEGALS